MVAPTGRQEKRHCPSCKSFRTHRRCNERNGWQCLSCYQFVPDGPPAVTIACLGGLGLICFIVVLCYYLL